MAIVWQATQNNQIYEVRTAGQSIRLYIDGVLHTQHHPEHMFTGSVWDLLSLSALCPPESQNPLRVLLLGVGGGSVIHQIHKLYPDAVIDGVDLSRSNLSVAKRFFNLPKRGITLVPSDGYRYIKQYRGPAYDLIIDDMFRGQDREPVRVIPVSRQWYQLLRSNLTSTGTLVFNFSDRTEFLNSPLDLVKEAAKLRIKGLQSLSTPTCDNRIVWVNFSTPPTTSIRQQLAKWQGLDCGRLRLHRRFLVKP